MKKLIAIVLAVSLVLTLVLGSGLALAAKPGNPEDGYNGNGAPSGKHYNLNIIGVPHGMNDNFSGGNGSRIFVLRTGTTKFYVGASDHYEIVDHDATDGFCGVAGNPGTPGILFPYVDGKWQVEIYARLLGPKTSEVKWKSYYFDGIEYIKFADFTFDRDTKFSLKTGQLLADGYENILWEMYGKEKFRLLQMRIYLTER